MQIPSPLIIINLSSNLSVAALFFAKDKSKLSLITHHAEYLNPLSQKQEGTPNLVDKSLQTTRRFDSLKLWLTLRIMGADKIGAIFDQVMQLAKDSHRLYQDDKSLELLHRPELSTLVFRFVPSHPTTDEEIDKANEHIRKAIFRSGEAVIASTQVKGKRYLKFTLLNPATQIEHIEEVVELIKTLGQQYFSITNDQNLEQSSQPNAVAWSLCNEQSRLRFYRDRLRAVQSWFSRAYPHFR
nr:pyridoxal-dependent decarboxylase [Photobacterium kishitanii]